MGDQVPYHHRVGIGYYPVKADAVPVAISMPTLPQPPGFWRSYPFPIASGSLPISAPAAPVGFHIPEAHGAPLAPTVPGWSWPGYTWPGAAPPPVATPPSPVSDDDVAPGRNIPGGLRKGHGYLFTGDACHVNVISCKSITLKKLLGNTFEEFDFKTWNVSSHTPMNNFIEMLEKKPKGKTLAWVKEEGDGVWMKVGIFKYKGDKGNATLGSHGWGKAGDDQRTQIWVIIEKE